MTNLFEATDYRPWLRDALRSLRRKHPARNARALAKHLGVDPAHLSRVFSGKRHLSVRHVPSVASFLGLGASDQRYLESLVRRCTAPTTREANRYFLEMQGLRGDLHRTLEDDAHAYFSSWLHPAMRTLLSLVEFRGLGWIRLANLFRPKVEPDDAQGSVELLQRLGLVAPDARGILRPADGTLSSGEDWVGGAVHEFQRQTLALAADLLDEIPREERDVSTLTLPASKARIGELRDRIRRFRQETMAWARDLPEEDCVVQLNIQLFPVADTRRSDRNKTVAA